MLAVNTSGHELSDLARRRIIDLLGPEARIVEFGAWDVGSPATGEELRDAVAALIGRINELSGQPHSGPPTLILPGFSPSVAMLLALWHGMAGDFPRLIWLQRGADGFTHPVSLDLSVARTWARESLRFGPS